MATSSRKWIWITAIALLVVAAAGAGMITLLFVLGKGERVEVRPRVMQNGLSGYTLLIDGVDHGVGLDKPTNVQDQGNPNKDFSRLGSTYYHREGPLGLVLERFIWFRDKENSYPSDARLPASLVGNLAQTQGAPLGAFATIWSEPPIGVLDLGAGTVASYARPLQTIDFYESNEAIKELSISKGPKPPAFGFVADALNRGANIRLFMGHQRKTLSEKGPEAFYHVLVIETARGHSDRPAVDRLTKEAMELYFDKLTQNGVACFHVSSRAYELSKVVVDVADSLGLVSLHGSDLPLGKDFIYSSEWVMVARKPATLTRLGKAPAGVAASVKWSNPPLLRAHVWTDQFQNLAAVRQRAP
ncbi:MAG: hypothetical protein HY040_26800 [Planctomycetes bacterium]|nr:hypothetical protein [Planctomycetota bacterium]